MRHVTNNIAIAPTYTINKTIPTKSKFNIIKREATFKKLNTNHITEWTGCIADITIIPEIIAPKANNNIINI